MTPKTLHTHARRILIGCLTALAASLAPASIAGATEYHHTSGTDITATGGRTCGHGLNGAPGGTPRIGIRTIYVESAISCNFGSSGVPANLQLSLYLYYEYGVVDPESLTVGYGSSRYDGFARTDGDYVHVEGWNDEWNIPTRFKVVTWSTYLLPLSGTEDFTSWPKSYDYDCSVYSRLHNSGWHKSGLSCLGQGKFTTGVAPYVD